MLECLFLSFLCDVNVDIIELWEFLSYTSLTLPPPTRAAGLEAPTTAGTRPLSYTNRKSRAETVTAQVHVCYERYNFTLDKTNELIGWLKHMTFSSFFFDSKLLSSEKGVLEHRVGPPRSIDLGSRLRE
jgi:hypothetical protein